MTHQETERKTIAALLTPSAQGTRSRKLQFTHTFHQAKDVPERTEDPQECFSILLKLIPFAVLFIAGFLALPLGACSFEWVHSNEQRSIGKPSVRAVYEAEGEEARGSQV